MNNFTRLSATLLLSGMALTAGAGSLGEAIVINPYPPVEYQTFLSAITVAYNFDLITIVDYDLTVKVSISGEEYEVYPEVYFDPEIAWDLGQTLDDPAWGNELVIDFSQEAYAEGYPRGLYTVEIPAGLVTDASGNTNPAQTITFTKVDPVAPISVTPENGMYPSLNEVTLTFDERLSLVPGGAITVREKNDWLVNPVYIDRYQISGDGKSLTFSVDLSKGINYMINVPKGFVKVGDYSVNEEVWMEYMVWDGLRQATVISAPAPETSQDLKPFILTWDYQPITISADAPDTEFVCGFPDYGLQDGWRIDIPASYYELVYIDEKGEITYNPMVANALRLDVAEFTKDFEGYRFEIFFPAGLVENAEGLTNPPLNYAFNVMNLWPDPAVKAGAGVITITWPDASWVTYNMSDDDPVLYSTSGDTYTLRFTFGGTSEGEVDLLNEIDHGIEINLAEMTLPNGDYTLIVPQGYVLLDGLYGEFVFNGAVKYQFGWKDGKFTQFDSVEMVKTDGEFTIYDLSGRRVKTDAVPASLSPGIYIVNGKKIIVM